MSQIDVYTLTENSKLNSFHLLILFWCSLMLIFDGYDLAVAGIALPLIMKDMGVTAASAGFMVSSALFGMVFGSVLLGTASDRIGRRRVMAISILMLTVFTAAAGFTRNPLVFGILRFSAGLGMGGIIPNAVAQMTEYAPRRLRGTMVSLSFAGFAAGGVLAAVLGKGLIEQFGWESVFIVAGVPFVLIPVVLRWMPESISYLVKSGRSDELRRILTRVEPKYKAQETDRFVLSRMTESNHSYVGELFAEGRGFSTVMLWTAFFISLFMVYGMNSWLTKLMANAGYSLGSALTFVLIFNFGAAVGGLAGGYAADRIKIKYVLVVMYLLSAVSIGVMGYGVPTWLLFVLVGLAGASTIGTQIVTLAFAGQFYPSRVRGTGVGWASGMGRIGAIIAPIVIGILVGMELPLQQSFLAIALPGILAAVAISLIDQKRSAHHRDADDHGSDAAVMEATLPR